MQYKFVLHDADYSDLASGRVFHSRAGHPAFPIRLGSEILQRCMVICAANGGSAPYGLYDPCCGAAYHLSVLAYLHGEMLREVVGSDIDEDAVTLAAQNLGLLRPAGLDGRIAHLQTLFAQYGKPSHSDALLSAGRMRAQVDRLGALQTRTFCASALDADALLSGLRQSKVDIVFTDIPYGQHSQWQGAGNAPVHAMLTALIPTLSPVAVVAIASDKQQKIVHAQYQRVEHFQIGKRRITILKPIPEKME